MATLRYERNDHIILDLSDQERLVIAEALADYTSHTNNITHKDIATGILRMVGHRGSYR